MSASIVVGIDSNALTYLIEAVQADYDPLEDDEHIAGERLAMVRTFFYADVRLWVPPIVEAEYRGIQDQSRLETHRRIAQYVLQDQPLGIASSALDGRVKELMRAHPQESDCRLVAEVECARLRVLLSCDTRLISKLNDPFRVGIVRPSQFWDSLATPKGAMPLIEPASGHPLHGKTWWRIGDA